MTKINIVLEWWEGLRDIKKCIEWSTVKNSNDKPGVSEDDLNFKQWKKELNKELLSFWKSIANRY